MDRRDSQDSDQGKQVQKRYQTLLPATVGTPISASSRQLLADSRKLPPKRRLVLVACLRCRKKKEKCDGERPSCGRCITKGSECVYEVDDARTSRTSALKRKCDSLQEENDQYKELFGILRKKPRGEAQDIFSRIRNAEEPVSVLKTIKDAELLLPWPSPGSASGSVSGSYTPHTPDATLEKFDADALAESPIKVKGSPWTDVAGDGVVSELISSFFAWDNMLLHAFIDRDMFLTDMERSNPKEARYCSPFLVNAICATRSFTSVRAKTYSDKAEVNLKDSFLCEARRLLALEGGKDSLPTAQGLALLFSACVYKGIDRPNMSYRYSYCEMLKKLNLEGRFARIRNDPDKQDERRAIARAQWGFFIFESIFASMYLQVPSINQPSISRTYLDSEADGMHNGGEFNSSFGSIAETDRTGSPPLVLHGAMDAAVDISVLLYESMRHNSDHNFETGSAEDLRTRRGLYGRALKLASSLPRALRSEHHFNPATCLLSIFVNDVALGILGPLRPSLIVEPSFESVQELWIRHCENIVSLLNRWTESWEDEYTFKIVLCAYKTAFTLTALLNEPSTHNLFARICEFIGNSAQHYPLSIYVLHGLLALGWAMSIDIPPDTRSYLENMIGSKGEEVRLEAVPIAYTIPYHDALRHLLPDEGDDWINEPSRGIELGWLLSKWSERDSS